MSVVPFTFLPHRGILSVSGEDRRSFLQGLTTNDMRRLADGRALWTAFLTPQGKCLREAFVVETGNAILLDTDAFEIDAFQTSLLRFRLRAKATVSLRPSWGVALASQSPSLPEGIAFLDPRLAEAGFRVIAPQTAFAARPSTDGEARQREELRLRLGLPDGVRDIVPLAGFPLEYGFDALRGLDFNKGCYIGQETTARMKWKSLVKKKLLPVLIAGPLPAPGTPVVSSDNAIVGEIRSGLERPGFAALALALLRLESVNASQPLRAAQAVLSPILPGWFSF